MVDVGANLGSISLPLAKRFPAWRFLGIEAHRGLAGVYAANALNNQLDNVEWLHAAAGRSEGLITFPAARLSAHGNFGDMSALYSNGPTERVRVCALDDIAPPDTKVIKIDVQGAEMDVLAGASALIARAKPTLLVEATRLEGRADANTTKVLEYLKSAGYRTYSFFSPFITSQRLKYSDSKLAIMGDYSIVALPEGVEPLWGLPEITNASEPWPVRFELYPYMQRYFIPAASPEPR